jgi:hypothetical protein
MHVNTQQSNKIIEWGENHKHSSYRMVRGVTVQYFEHQEKYMTSYMYK